jgi:hypothetical protein
MKKIIISESQYKLLFENLNYEELNNLKRLLDSEDESNVQIGIQILDANEYPIIDFIEKFYSKTIYRPFSNALQNNLPNETILELLKNGFHLEQFPKIDSNTKMEYIHYCIDEGVKLPDNIIDYLPSPLKDSYINTRVQKAIQLKEENPRYDFYQFFNGVEYDYISNEQMFSLGEVEIIIDTFTIKYINKTYPEKLENYINGYINYITNKDYHTVDETLLDFFNENNLKLYINSTDTLESNVLYQMSKVSKPLLSKYLKNKIQQAIENDEFLGNNEDDYFEDVDDQNLVNQYYEKFKEYYED